MKYSPIWKALICFAAALSISQSYASLPAPGIEAAFVVNFPSDNGVFGTLQTIDAKSSFNQEHPPGKKFAEMRGRVTLPPNTRIGVVITNTLCDPFPALALLPADRVYSLSLSGSGAVSDVNIKKILRFKNLKRLQCDGTDLTDACLSVIAGLPDLECLVLSHMELKGATLSKLSSLKELRRLDLNSNDIDPHRLPDLAPLHKLEWLSVGRCHLRNGDLAFLKKMPQLKKLDLFENPFLSDEGMNYVTGLHNIFDLRIEKTHITFNGVKMLKSLPIKQIKVSPEAFTTNQQAEIRKLFPGVLLAVDDGDAKTYTLYKELFQ